MEGNNKGKSGEKTGKKSERRCKHYNANAYVRDTYFKYMVIPIGIRIKRIKKLKTCQRISEPYRYSCIF